MKSVLTSLLSSVLESPFFLIVLSWGHKCLELFQREPVLVIMNAGLVSFIIYLLFVQRFSPKKETKLTKKEEEELIADWKPEPLVPLTALEMNLMKKKNELIVSGTTGPTVKVNDKICYNFASYNFLGIASEDEIKTLCEATIRKYGVGSCGPRGFYGTIDVHLDLEKRIAEFFGTEESILYSDGIACLSSVIPAFSKAGDTIICDENVNYHIQQGNLLSRSRVIYFKHNDLQHLEQCMKQVAQENRENNRSLHRQFVVVEGIYQNYGDCCPLFELNQLAKKYCYRIILDDSMAIGVLGASGRGTPEKFNVPMVDIDIYCATLDSSIASCGGFCAGSHEVCNHQRLSGAGYCFSASSPPYTCTAAIAAFDIIDRDVERIRILKSNSEFIRKSLSQLNYVSIEGPEFSPLIHIRFSDFDLATVENLYEKLYENHDIIVCFPRYIPQELNIPKPSLCVLVTSHHSKSDLLKLLEALKIEIDSIKGTESSPFHVEKNAEKTIKRGRPKKLQA